MTVSAFTANWRFKLIDFNSANWHSDEWDNWKLVDALFESQFTNIPFAVATGTGNAIVLDYTPSVVYASGLHIMFKVAANNTGAVTVNCDGLGAKNLLVLGSAAQADDLVAGSVVRMVYDGVQFNLVEPVQRTSKFSVIVGASNASVPNANADDLIVKSDANAGISILTPNTATGSLYFGDPENSAIGGITYNHATNQMTVISGGKVLFDGKTAFGVEFDLNGANNLRVGEIGTTGVVQIGNSNDSNSGLFVNTVIGRLGINQPVPIETLHVEGGAYIVGNLTITGALGAASFPFSSTIGTVPVNRGGTGATDAATARSNFGLGALAVLGTINGSNWSGADLALADGGTGASTAGAAFNNIAASGGTVGGAIVRSGLGAYPHFNDALVTNPKIFLQASGSDPTANPGDMVLEW